MKKLELQEYKDHLREGLVKYTRKAFRILPEMKTPCILDIGCGTGVITIELAKLSDGKITAVDNDQSVLDRLAAKIKKAGLAERVNVRKCSMLNMGFPAASFDIIWAEGSIAVIGFERGLREWRRLLKTGGFLVVHDELGDSKKKQKQISACGYKLINHFILDENAWWNEYYAPLEKKLSEFEINSTRDQREISDYKRDPEQYRSVFFIMNKTRKINDK